MKADFSSPYGKQLLSTHTFDFIHASPVCRTFSMASGGYHRNKQNFNITHESHEADAMLLELYSYVANALKANKNTTVTIENPKGWMRKCNVMVSNE